MADPNRPPQVALLGETEEVPALPDHAQRNRLLLTLALAIAVAIVTRDWLLALGLVMAGQEAEGSEASTTGVTETWKAYRQEVLKTGNVEVLHIKLAAAITGTVKLVVGEDAGAANAPGAMLREVEATVTSQTHIEIAVSALEVTAGTFVWLAFWTSAQNKVKLGATTTSRNASTKKAKYSEATWGAETKQGPISIWATGTETGGGVTIPLAAAASTSAASLAVSAPTAVPLTSAASASAAALAMTVPTTVPLSAATSTSAAGLTLSAPTTIPLSAAASTSSASLAASAATRVGLNPAGSTSTASLALNAPTTVPLAPASSTSAASLQLSGPIVLALASASATSAAKLTVITPAPPTPRFPTTRPLAGRIGGPQTGNVARTRPGKVGP